MDSFFLNKDNKLQFLKDECPKVLYHYSTVSGVLGVLNSGKLWATNIWYLNDHGELAYGIDRILEMKEKRIQALIDKTEGHEKERQKNTLEELFKFLLQPLLDKEAIRSIGRFYVSCFCENGDLLSQWRAYGDKGAGYSLGFRTSSLRKQFHEANLGHSLPSVIAKVEYKKDVQEKILNDIMDFHKENLDTALRNRDEDQIQKTRRLLLSDLLVHIAFFKNSAFSEENEWRAVSSLGHKGDKAHTKFRPSRDFLVPYIELPISEDSFSSRSAGEEGDVIEEIIIGPHREPDLAKDSLVFFLEKMNVKARVRNSNATLRV